MKFTKGIFLSKSPNKSKNGFAKMVFARYPMREVTKKTVTIPNPGISTGMRLSVQLTMAMMMYTVRPTGTTSNKPRKKNLKSDCRFMCYLVKNKKGLVV